MEATITIPTWNPDRLRRAREAASLRQVDLARVMVERFQSRLKGKAKESRVNSLRISVVRWETPGHTEPGRASVAKLAAVLCVDEASLFC